MKKKSFFLLVTAVIVFVIVNRYNGAIKSFFLDLINPIKIAYLKATNISDSYLKQQENILRLEKENKIFEKLLIEQSNYIQELSKIYKLLPSLAKKPYKSIYITNAISYVKLNHLDEITLTTPKNFKLKESKPYGLLKNDATAGIANYKDGKLYGYLLSNPRCVFSVIIGDKKANGIAQGDAKEDMIIKFIPRWSNIQIGDIVKTSGLDNIFFPNIPVGIVSDIKLLDKYKEAKIKVYANLTKPTIFFLISDSTPYLTIDYLPKTSFPKKAYPFVPIQNSNKKNIEAEQTQESAIEPKKIDEKDYLNLF